MCPFLAHVRYDVLATSFHCWCRIQLLQLPEHTISHSALMARRATNDGLDSYMYSRMEAQRIPPRYQESSRHFSDTSIKATRGQSPKIIFYCDQRLILVFNAAKLGVLESTGSNTYHLAHLLPYGKHLTASQNQLRAPRCTHFSERNRDFSFKLILGLQRELFQTVPSIPSGTHRNPYFGTYYVAFTAYKRRFSDFDHR